MIDVIKCIELFKLSNMSNNENKNNVVNPNFIKVNNKLYNLNYIKEIECTDTKCTFKMVTFHNSPFDDTCECSKYKSPDCYNTVSKFIDSYQ